MEIFLGHVLEFMLSMQLILNFPHYAGSSRSCQFSSTGSDRSRRSGRIEKNRSNQFVPHHPYQGPFCLSQSSVYRV